MPSENSRAAFIDVIQHWMTMQYHWDKHRLTPSSAVSGPASATAVYGEASKDELEARAQGFRFVFLLMGESVGRMDAARWEIAGQQSPLDFCAYVNALLERERNKPIERPRERRSYGRAWLAMLRFDLWLFNLLRFGEGKIGNGGRPLKHEPSIFDRDLVDRVRTLMEESSKGAGRSVMSACTHLARQKAYAEEFGGPGGADRLRKRYERAAKQFS